MKNVSKYMVICLAVCLTASSSLLGQDLERPSSIDLLPQETVAYVQIPDVDVLKESFSQTGFGQMLQDEKVKPMVDQAFAELEGLYATYIEEEIGVSLNEILQMPAGEICFAVVAPRRKTPALVLMMDFSQESDTADRLLERGREFATEEGADLSSETEGEFEVNLVDGGDEDEFVGYVRKDDSILICSNREVLSEMLLRWQGTAPEGDKTLADNRKFVTIMNRSKSVHDDNHHQLAFFIDPFELISSSLRGQSSRQLTLGIVRTAGLDGLLAIGGTSLFNEQGYESILHLHVSLANPRKGVFKIVALKPGFYEPEPWVPADAVSYVTSNWDVNNIYQQAQGIYESYDPPTTWEEAVEDRFSAFMEMELKGDLFDQFSGRMTYVTWNEPPARMNSQMNILALGLNDPGEFRDVVLQKILDKSSEIAGRDVIDIDDYRGIEIWQRVEDDARAERRDRMRTEMAEEGMTLEMRLPEPCMAIIGDSFIICENRSFVELAIDTYQGNESSLAAEPTYSHVTEQMTRLLGTDLPSMSMYSRPDEQFKNMFATIDSDGVKDFLATQAEEYDFAGGMLDVLDENEVPSFEDIADYLAPSGAFVTNDETGWHLLAFQLKAKNVLDNEKSKR